MDMQLRDIAAATSGQLHGADAASEMHVRAVNTDSRQPVPASLFVALRGERFDAHEFAAGAIAGGAIALLVERVLPLSVPQIVVADTRRALGDLARAWRRRCAATVVGLTGSAGKTTVKEMIASILRQDGETLATQGNLNNDIGVPLTLFRLQPSHRYAVIEMGANHAGEIAYCAAIAEPSVAAITLIGAAHLEGFGSIEGVARAKSEIFAALPTNGCAVLNQDALHQPILRAAIGSRKTLGFGSTPAADIRAENIVLDSAACARFTLVTPRGQVAVQLPVPGQHNVMNALAAAGVGEALGLPLARIAKGLQETPVVGGRLVRKQTRSGAALIDDTYNANLESVKAAIDLLVSLPGQPVLVLGDMGELGAEAAAIHAEVGRYAREKRLAALYSLGKLSAETSAAFGAGGQHFLELEPLLVALQTALTATHVVLVKGSRSARMERVVSALSTPNNDKDHGEMH
ncbi:UDP-N-acetylmuramoyl-tripeptide--D-alanyl-D-alanine ligase [Permianibacter sp. IMCC34836]|uniref:UDP-N-acetylmuramoyl-tripeptide--D-alanyl-D- alanine ligase n=1 Tax=Permianibacter fluminis TaxID=2738515 RepID=UPI001B7D80F2|nr:UDP-N-acetylmuramoyl-tripeptide--D-alanyl-D-alanine ligase [Permianibacter fluminis]NQD37010.1 UDP-N-acetylmuramoyl-tripeptide--D-alanyl-D-alanine ligase [Permianibacter fluminis]